MLSCISFLPSYGQVESDSLDLDSEYLEEEDYYEEVEDQMVSEENFEPRPINFVQPGIQISIPQTAFRRNHPRVFGGAYVNYYRQFKLDHPLFLGFTIGYNLIDNYEDQVDRIFDTFTEIWDGSTTSSMIDFSVGAKYFININLGPIEPYLEFNIGGNWLYTRTTFSFPESDESDSRYEKGDIVLSYGGAIGFMINLASNIYLDTSIGYHPGLSANYFVEKNEKEEQYNSTIQAFDLKKSTTDMLKARVGVNFIF